MAEIKLKTFDSMRTKPLSVKTATPKKPVRGIDSMGINKPRPTIGGPTMTSTAGVGLKGPLKRPESSRSPTSPRPLTTKPTMSEEAPAMSVGSGAAVSSITDPTTNYAFQKKKKFSQIDRRKPPKVV